LADFSGYLSRAVSETAPEERMGDIVTAAPTTQTTRSAMTREQARVAAQNTHIPTCSFRWMRDYDGERILQQRCTTTGGTEFWKDVQEVNYAD
jgi:formate-dependent phosphoribosylglycinamide formyltransferase (GAR transformylase)